MSEHRGQNRRKQLFGRRESDNSDERTKWIDDYYKEIVTSQLHNIELSLNKTITDAVDKLVKMTAKLEKLETATLKRELRLLAVTGAVSICVSVITTFIMHLYHIGQ